MVYNFYFLKCQTGMILYELHVPLVCLANKKYENGRTTQPDQLIVDLKEAEIYLKEAVQILIHEPITTPESRIARAAMADLKQLREYIRHMEKLKHNLISNWIIHWINITYGIIIIILIIINLR